MRVKRFNENYKKDKCEHYVLKYSDNYNVGFCIMTNDEKEEYVNFIVDYNDKIILATDNRDTHYDNGEHLLDRIEFVCINADEYGFLMSFVDDLDHTYSVFPSRWQLSI